MTNQWKPDILGAPFEQLTLDLGKDDEGPMVATLVRCLPTTKTTSAPLQDVDVLYVHGWSDYFFQTDLAHYWNELGARFYALDLRKYGRSMRPGQTPGYIDDLAKYDVEIGAALDQMQTASSGRRLVLFGHSTGGLTLTLWASRHHGLASALVLNSPWFEFQAGSAVRHAIRPFIHLHARNDPKARYPETDFGFYADAQKMIGTSPAHIGPEEWRPKHGFPTTTGWLHAIMEAQNTLTSHDLNVGIPSLVLLSGSDSPWYAWSKRKTKSDSVLVVDDIARVSARIFPEVTIARIQDALHDVFLSRQDVRAHAYNMMGSWLLGGALMPPRGLPTPPPIPDAYE